MSTQTAGGAAGAAAPPETGAPAGPPAGAGTESPSRQAGWISRLQNIRVPLIGGGRKPKLDPKVKLRLKLLALSARAAALAARMEALAEKRDADEFNAEEFDRTDAEIRAIVSQLEQMEAEAAGDLHTWCVAVAVAQNSIGRALHLKAHHHKLKSCYADAIRCFDRAIYLVPSMPDPYIGKAAVLFKQQDDAGLDWPDQAEALLARAIELSPRNGKAHYYRGRLAMYRGDYKQALRMFDKADVHPWMLYHKAVILAKHVKPLQRMRALELLHASISMLNRVDERYALYADTVLDELAEKTKVEPDLFERAAALASDLADRGITDDCRNRGRELMRRLEDAREGAQRKDWGRRRW